MPEQTDLSRLELFRKIERLEEKLDRLSDKLHVNVTDIALLKLKVTLIAVMSGMLASAVMQWLSRLFF